MKKNYSKYKKQATKLKQIIEKDFTSDKMYNQFMSHFENSKGVTNEII